MHILPAVPPVSFRGKENSFLGLRTQYKITRCTSCHFSLVSVNQEWLLCSLSPVTLILLKSAGQLFVEYPCAGACFFPHIGLNHLLLWFLSNGGFSNSPPSPSVQSFVSVRIRGIVFYSAHYTPLLLLVLMLKLSHTWPERTPSGCLPRSLDVSLSCVDSSLLLSGTTRCSTFISYFLSPGISISPRSPSSFSGK